MLDNAFKRVAVLGAAGKMGSGISLLLLQEMARERAERGIENEDYHLILIDTNDQGLASLLKYLKSQLRRYAEKQINLLRKYYAHLPGLISNEEIIESFVDNAFEMVRLETEITEARKASLIFEAILESVDAKAQVFSLINSVSIKMPFFFTNTSSIPIGALDEKGNLEGRIIGFHFYNPPPVQRLVEIIPADSTAPQLAAFAEALAAKLGKVPIFSKDVAGFIGNGHFMREIDFALKKVRELEKKHPRHEAIWIVNRVTQDYLIRPMGIFQLLDYVGLDVCQRVMDIMSLYLQTTFETKLIDQFLRKGVTGGQRPDGSQKDGIFRYERGRVRNIWEDGKYISLPEANLGSLPAGHHPWKTLHQNPNREKIINSYLHNLFDADQPGALLAQEFLLNSREIAKALVNEGVAKNIGDVNSVLKHGFYHLYGADNAGIPEPTKVRSGE